MHSRAKILHRKIKQILTQKNFPQGNCYSLILNRMFAQVTKYCHGLSKIPGRPCQTEFHIPTVLSLCKNPSPHTPHLSLQLMPSVGLNDKQVTHLLAMEWTKENGISGPKTAFTYYLSQSKYAVFTLPISIRLPVDFLEMYEIAKLCRERGIYWFYRTCLSRPNTESFTSYDHCPWSLPGPGASKFPSNSQTAVRSGSGLTESSHWSV